MEAATTATGMEALVTIFTQIMAWMTSLVTTIVNTPLLLIPVGIMCVGAVIGLSKRLIGA